MPEWLFELLINMEECLVVVGFLTLYLGPKYRGWKAGAAFFAGWLASLTEICIVNYLIFFDSLETYVSLFLFFVYALLFLQGNWAQKLWGAVLTQATVTTINLLGIIGFCTATGYDPVRLVSVYNPTRVMVVLLVQVMHIPAYLLLLKFRRIAPMQKRLWVALSVIPWVSVASLSTLVELSIEFPQYQKRILMSMLCILVANVMTYYFLIVISRGHEDHLKVELLEQESENRQKEMESASAFLEEMRRVRHDMKNQLLIIKGHLADNQPEEAVTYIDRLIGEFLPGEFVAVNTGTPAFDALINAKAALARQKGINLVIRANPSAAESMADIDRMALLGNLLDNALEAAEKSEEKSITLSVDEKERYASVLIKNSIDQSVLQENPELVTTKGDSSRHGIGLKSAHMMAEKQEGMLQFYEEDGAFCAHVLLPKV